MRRLFFITFIHFLLSTLLFAEGIRPTKNLIVMIPDGTSLSVLSASRWVKFYRNEGNHLNLDPYLCGTVTTFSSNAPIGDSAPTTSTYMTGVPMLAGQVSIYSKADPENDIIKLNPDSIYQPLVTILEAMKMEQKKATGLVVTCEFPQATPADCASHYYDRENYRIIAQQMAYNDLTIMFGGGTALVSEDMKYYFKKNGTDLILDNKNGLLNYNGEKVWALFRPGFMSFDLDRNTEKEPSLAEMTTKALEILDKNENGFFLLVEGSKVDWSAHGNDPAGMISEFLAFDNAVGEAIRFAQKDGNTTVVILPDHGNSGFSIGRYGLKKSVNRLTLKDHFDAVSKIKRTSNGMEELLLSAKPEEFREIFKTYSDIDLTDEELNLLLNSKNYKREENYTKKSESNNMGKYITAIYTDRTTFGFTSGSHTGEEVFLAVYHPKGDILKGNVLNVDLHNYLYKVSGLKTTMKEHTSNTFAQHTSVFDEMKYKIIENDGQFKKLTVSNKKNKLEITAFSSVAKFNGDEIDLGSVVVFIDKNNTFYLPKYLREKMMK